MSQLFTNQTANADSAIVDFDPGHAGFQVSGTFDGANVTVKISLDGTNYVALGAAISAAGVVIHELPVKCKLKLTLASVGAGTSINAHFVRS